MGKRKSPKIARKAKQLLDNMDKAENYPFCTGAFDNCPGQITDKANPPAQCFRCPLYTESRYYHSPKIEMDDFAKSVFSKK